MKKMIKNSFVVVALVFLSSSVFAGDPYVRVKQKGSKEFFLFIGEKDISKDGMVITLKSQRGRKLYNETLKNQLDYAKVYNLNELPKGQYVLNIKGDTEVKAWTLEISREGLSLKKINESNITVASDNK